MNELSFVDWVVISGGDFEENVQELVKGISYVDMVGFESFNRVGFQHEMEEELDE